MPVFNFDWLTVHRVSKKDFRSGYGFDHWGDYFKSDRGGRAKVAFRGSGHVDILFGRAEEWGTSTRIVDEVISGDKTFEIDVPAGYTFEPRAYEGSAITMIETIGPLALLGVAAPIIVGAGIGGAIGYFLKEPLGPMVSEAVGAALGGGVGLLIGLGVIPVPQIPIPALGAPLEGSEAPVLLGKYQITS